MNEYRKEIMRNVYLTVLPARKFKTGCLSAQFVTALGRETYQSDRAEYLRFAKSVRTLLEDENDEKA